MNRQYIFLLENLLVTIIPMMDIFFASHDQDGEDT